MKFQAWATAPARHLFIRLVALAELPEVASTPRVQRTAVGDCCGVEAAARDEADALAAQALRGVSAWQTARGSERAHTFHYFGCVLVVLVAVPETAAPEQALDKTFG